MVFASFILFIGLTQVVEVIVDNIGDSAKIEEHVSLGTFKLLDQSIQNVTLQERDKKISEYKTVFGPEFDLLNTSSLNFTAKHKQQLDKNEVVVIDNVVDLELLTQDHDSEDAETIDLIFRQHLDTDYVWRIHLDTDVDLSIDNTTTTLSIEGEHYTKGLFYVLEQRLSNLNIKEIKNTLKEIMPEYGLTLNLLDKKELAKYIEGKEELQNQFAQNKVINIIQNSKDVTFFHAFPDPNYALQVGPIEIPWIIRNSIFMVILLILFSIATALFLWLWPLWSNLLKIKNTAIKFGQGDYNARIPIRKRSALAPIANAFNAMAETTQQGITTQKELTTAVSHELRTPVARMRFALEMLEDSHSEDDKARYIESLNTDMDDLDSLLEELLSYARFDQQEKQNKENIDLRFEKLSPWLSVSMEKLMPLADGKLLNYHITGIGINESAYFEPRLMTRVLDNLVQNALRYATNSVEVSLCKDTDDYVLIVDDDGQGIDDSDKKHIFDAFSRIDTSRDRSTGGFGLGLAIADRIIKAHQGTIIIQKSKLGGASFIVRWPIKIDKN